MLLSLSWSTEISPVKAPLGLSKTFCAATSSPGLRCSRARRRYRAGGAMTTSVKCFVSNCSRTVSWMSVYQTRRDLLHRDAINGRSSPTSSRAAGYVRTNIWIQFGIIYISNDLLDGVNRPIPKFPPLSASFLEQLS